jgi:hypothetical protein
MDIHAEFHQRTFEPRWPQTHYVGFVMARLIS